MLNCSKYFTRTMNNFTQPPKLQTAIFLSNKFEEENKEVYTVWSISSKNDKTSYPNTTLNKNIANITCFHILTQSKN